MSKYWIKIVVTALAIGLVGLGLVTAGRKGRSYIESAKDLTIPLGSFVSFKLDGVKAGSIRSLSIQRSAPKDISGFGLSIRVTDSAAFTRLQNCKIAIDDVQRFDERTTFRCLTDTTGYVAFGEISLRSQTDGDSRELTAPLLLPERAVRDIQSHATTTGTEVSPGFADSLAGAIKLQVRSQARSYADSLRAEKLDRAATRMSRSAEDLKAQADSIRALRAPPAPPPPAAKKPQIP